MIETALALLLALDESSEAEAIYHRMEAKILGARTLLVRARLRFEGDRRGEPEVRLRVVKAENKIRYDRLRDPGEFPDDARIVSDGRQLRSQGGFSAEGEVETGFRDLGEVALVMFSRWGIERGVEGHLWYGSKYQEVRRPVLEDFRILHREEVGPRKTVAITYVLSFPLADRPGVSSWKRSTTLWIDEETFLPVQRVQHDGGRCIHWTTIETYEELRFDEEMPADRFTLPGSAPSPAPPKRR